MLPPLESRQVSWQPVAMFVAAMLAQANASPPIAGTPAWQRLADSDPLKLLSVAVPGVSRVIEWDDEQQSQAEASRAISAAADWPQAARELQQLHRAREAGTRIERKAS